MTKLYFKNGGYAMTCIEIQGIGSGIIISGLNELIDIRRAIIRDHDLDKARKYCTDWLLANWLYTWPEAFYVSDRLKETINRLYKEVAP